MSNQKQIALGILMYTQDYDEHYPMTWYGADYTGTVATPGTPVAEYYFCLDSGCPGGANYNYSWMDLIYPYVKNVQLFTCPSNSTPKQNGRLIPSYWFNPAFGNPKTGSSGYATRPFGREITYITGISTAAVERPSTTAMLGEISNSTNNSKPKILFIWGAQAYIPLQPELFKTHLEGTNLAYADGHAKWMSSTSLRSETGSDSNVCNLNSPSNQRIYCSKLWNPFRP
jgi:prepilin-type processing-associated H-X9-DG protein